MRPSCCTTLAATLFLSLAPPSGAQDLVQAGPGLVAYATSTGHRIEVDGAVRALPLPPSAELSDVAAVGGGWLAAASELRPEGRGLLLMGNEGGTVHRVAAPRTAARLAVAPRLLVAGGGTLTAVAWLEGEDPGSLGVRAARWINDGWGPSTTISPPGPGSQLALAGSVLPDGELLLAWAAFDGADDEILWTVSGPAGWATPQRLGGDNAVPDVLPTLLPLADGALAAWSRYDGNDYRLVVARYAGGSWEEPRMVGTAGTVGASAVGATGAGLGAGAGDGVAGYILCHAAGEQAWHLLEVGAEGALLRLGAAGEGEGARPALQLSGAAVELRWPGAGPARQPAWRPLEP